MSHTCKAVAIRCIDFRLRTPLTEFFREQGLENQVDDPGLAGGVKDLVEPSGNPDVVLKQISVATALHGVSKVLLINHTDCGAYGGSGAFSDETAERAKHEADLAAAAATVHERFPQVTVEKVLAVIEPGHGTPTVRFEFIP